MSTSFDWRPALVEIIREGSATLTHGVLAPFALLPSRHKTERKADLRTTVFVHGLHGNRANFYPLQAWLGTKGHRRQLGFNQRSGPSIEAMAVHLKRTIDAKIKGGRIDIVAHSLGGLVSRTYIQALGGDRRVDRLITLGTPHHGSHAAWWAPTKFVRQLAPRGPFLTWLNGLAWPDRVAITSLSAGTDHLVLPSDSAHYPHGRWTRHEALGHTGLLLSPNVFRDVEAALARPSPCLSQP